MLENSKAQVPDAQGSAAVARWIMELAAESPDLFGGKKPRKISVLEEPQVFSHNTMIYDVGDARVHVKFFSRTLGHTNITYDPCREMEAEYDMLKEYEKKGFDHGRYRVVPALGANESLDCALATMYVGGYSLQSIIYDVIEGKTDEDGLYLALELTAGLLKKIHTTMPQTPHVNGSDMFYDYLKSMLYLEEQNALDGFHRRTLKGLSRWYNYRPLFEQRGVTVHGDANPSNFKIDDGVIYAFDVERSRRGMSAALDVGTVIAELRHHFAYRTGDSRNSDPYVNHFLRAYAPGERVLDRLKAMLSFFISQSFFKIAMLGYWKPEYKKWLVEEGVRSIEVKP